MMLKGRHFDSSAILLCVLRYAAYGVRAGHRLAHIGFSNFEGSRDGTGRRLLVKINVQRDSDVGAKLECPDPAK
jgi:hypothetical protein